jgi:hypothetical protein
MLVGSMLAQLQDDRPTIQDIVEYPFVKEMAARSVEFGEHHRTTDNRRF